MDMVAWKKSLKINNNFKNIQQLVLLGILKL